MDGMLRTVYYVQPSLTCIVVNYFVPIHRSRSRLLNTILPSTSTEISVGTCTQFNPEINPARTFYIHLCAASDICCPDVISIQGDEATCQCPGMLLYMYSRKDMKRQTPRY